MRLAPLLFASFAIAAQARADAIFLSPTGNDSGECSESAPCKTFAKAFGVLKPGGELVLLDGKYGASTGTGAMHHLGIGSSLPLAGLPGRPTVIRAKNPGKVTVERFSIGTKIRKDSHIRIQGITFPAGGQVYNGDYITIKESGFGAPLLMGTNDHQMGNSHNLVEDVWIWGAGHRALLVNYRSNNNVWRRVVVRGDGCGGTGDCKKPNIGTTIYDSHDVSFQNVIVVDRILVAGDSPYADFGCAQHTPDPKWYFGRNEWLGTISVNAPDSSYYCEPDVGATIDPTMKYSNVLAFKPKGIGLNLDRAGTNNVIENITVVVNGGAGIRVGSGKTTGTLRGVLITGEGYYGINSLYKPSNSTVHGTFRAPYYSQATCSVGCSTADPKIADPTRGLPDRGATIVNRYGADGSRFGDAEYNTLTSVPLWPWPNEERIKAEMCASVKRGFCSAPSLTEYVRGG